MPGVLLCGVAVTLGNTPIVIGRITGITGFGVERQAVDNIHNDVLEGWAERLVSCIQIMKPFRVSIVHASNAVDWVTFLTQRLEAASIIWPVESGYTTGAVYAFDAAVTDYTCGSPDIQQRVNAEMTITPSGKLTITPGAVVIP